MVAGSWYSSVPRDGSLPFEGDAGDDEEVGSDGASLLVRASSMRPAFARRLAAAASLLAVGALLLAAGAVSLTRAPTTSREGPLGREFDDKYEEMPVQNWTREHIGLLKNIMTGKCLDLRGIALLQRNASAMLAECNYEDESLSQRWAVDVQRGFIRNLETNGHCLDVVGHPGWKDGAALDASPCAYHKDKDSTDQRWKFDPNGFILNRLSGLCISPVNSTGEQTLQIANCELGSKTTGQTFQFIGLHMVAAMQGIAHGRPEDMVAAEDRRRQAIKSGDDALLVLDDFVRVSDPTVLLDGQFFQSIFTSFHDMTPKWDDWKSISDLWVMLSEVGPVQKAFGTVYILNFLSNMAFAGMNFVSGFKRIELSFMHSFFNLTLQDFVGPEPAFGCHSGPEYEPFCKSPTPVAGEKTEITDFQSYIEDNFNVQLPSNSFFKNVFMGEKTPSWEDNAGHDAAFSLVDAGIQTARKAGVEPMQKVREMTGPRFAFDSEGLTRVFEAGFGWMKAHEVKYASNGAYGTAVLEKLMKKSGNDRDVLGALLTDSVLSMHLTYDDALMNFVVDLTSFEKYKPLPGYSPLGGKALLVQRAGRLRTMQLEYQGHVYKEADFTDKATEEDYALRSKLSGWRLAEKAIIASLWAKTQLLVHVKTLHLELSPALQAVTVDTFAENPRHPLRRLLELFTSRSIQAAKTNIRTWFQYRAGEFSLAPLPIEEQLKLAQDTMEQMPLNLADLDMHRYAEARGMSKFSQPPVSHPETGDDTWSWRWHYRATKVEELIDDLVGCWLDKHYGGNDERLAEDSYVELWWKSLQEHMPALRMAAEHSTDWLTSAANLQPPVPPGAAASASGAWTSGRIDDASVYPSALLAQEPADAAPPATTAPSTTTTKATTPPATTTQGFFSVREVHEEESSDKLGGVTLPNTQPPNTPPPVPVWEPPTPESTTIPVSDMWRRRRLQEPAATAKPFPVNVESLRRVLRTLMLWGSWIHEDVGHSAASLLYDPVNVPLFVPADGIGIPLVPLAVAFSVYRDFIFVERAKLVDPLPSWVFDQKVCHTVLFTKQCHEPVDDKKCFADFQEKLVNLSKSSTAFSECDEHGFYSCVDRVEISASS